MPSLQHPAVGMALAVMPPKAYSFPLASCIEIMLSHSKVLHTIYWCNIWKILHTTNLPWLPPIKTANMDKIWKTGVHIHLVATTFKCLRKAQVRKMLQSIIFFTHTERIYFCNLWKYVQWGRFVSTGSPQKNLYIPTKITPHHTLVGQSGLEPWQTKRTLCYSSVHHCWPWCLMPCCQAGKIFPH